MNNMFFFNFSLFPSQQDHTTSIIEATVHRGLIGMAL